MSIDPNEIDLLVDGELPDDRRKRLLLSLEQAPEGWRACALAFLEAQCWREQMRGMADAVRQSPHSTPRKPASAHATPPSESQTPAAAPAAKGRARPVARTLLAMAASFLATMIGVGLLRMHWLGSDVSPRELVDTTRWPKKAPTAAAPEEELGSKIVDVQGAFAPKPDPDLPAPGVDSQFRREWVLPVVEASHFNDGLLAPSGPTSVDPHLEALARRNGMDIQRHRQMMPLHTSDGRDIIVPVNSYQFRRRDAADIQ
jgi:hypothetical protein